MRVEWLLGARPAPRTPAGRATLLAMRTLAAASVVISGIVHFRLWREGFSTLSVIGPLFLLNAIGGLLIGLALLAWRHWLPALAAIGFGATTLVAFWISVAFGLFGLHEINSGDPQLTAEAAEIAAVVFGAGALMATWPGRGRHRRHPAQSGGVGNELGNAGAPTDPPGQPDRADLAVGGTTRRRTAQIVHDQRLGARGDRRTSRPDR